MSPRNYRETFPIHYEAGKSINDIASFHMNAKGIEAVKAAISKGKDPDEKDDQGRTALYIAIKTYNYDIAKYLGGHPKVDIRLKDGKGDAALDWAILHMSLICNSCYSLKDVTSPSFLNEWIEIIKILIFRGADTEAYFVRGTDAAEKENTIKDRIKSKLLTETSNKQLTDSERLDQVVSKAIYPNIQWIIRSAFQDIETVFNKYGLSSQEAASAFACMSKKKQKDLFLERQEALTEDVGLPPAICAMIIRDWLPTFSSKFPRDVSSQDLSFIEHKQNFRQASP